MAKSEELGIDKYDELPLKYPEAAPRIISDNGPQFIARDFRAFIRMPGMTHVRASPFCPRANGAYGKKPTDEKTQSRNLASSQSGNPVHCLKIARDGLLYACDRSNNRIQVFRKDGNFLKEFVIEKNARAFGSARDLDSWIDPKQTLLFHADGTNNEMCTLERETGDIVGTPERNTGEFHSVHNVALGSKGTYV
jgi:hypothetical protein